MQSPPDENRANLALVHVGEPASQPNRPVQPIVAFDRRELTQILAVYGRNLYFIYKRHQETIVDPEHQPGTKGVKS